ncbi:MAG: hypothetical protein ACKVXR_04640 [Planctomycetota bacterium]
MKQFAPILLVLFIASSCEKSADAAATIKGASGSVDLSKLTPEAMKTEGSKLVSQVTSKLGEIKDLASAENAVKQLDPLIGNLGMLKDKLGAGGLDLSSIQSSISGLTSKFGSDTKIMGALKPLLDKLQAMLK